MKTIEKFESKCKTIRSDLWRRWTRSTSKSYALKLNIGLPLFVWVCARVNVALTCVNPICEHWISNEDDDDDYAAGV